jgi:hypothetical protein
MIAKIAEIWGPERPLATDPAERSDETDPP